MVTVVNEPVLVHLVIDALAHTVVPQRIKWRGKVYATREIGFVHAYRRGRTKVHVFSLNVGNLDMRLEIDGDSLCAILVAVSDGLAD